VKISVPRVAVVVDDSMLIRHTVCRFLQERGAALRLKARPTASKLWRC
jgi:hypothetical protein